MKDNNMPRGVKAERPVSTEPVEVIYVLFCVLGKVLHHVLMIEDRPASPKCQNHRVPNRKILKEFR